LFRGLTRRRAGSVWFGLVRSGSGRFGPVRSSSVRPCSVRFGPLRYGSVWFGPVRAGSVQFGPVRSDLVRFGPVRPRPVSPRPRCWFCKGSTCWFLPTVCGIGSGPGGSGPGAPAGAASQMRRPHTLDNFSEGKFTFGSPSPLRSAPQSTGTLSAAPPTNTNPHIAANLYQLHASSVLILTT